MPSAERARRFVAAALPVALAAWVYYPITRTYFWADDFACFAILLNDGFWRFALRPWGGHNLLARNLVFYGSFQLFGLHAELFFWSVLLTHLLNVWLLFRVLRNLTASPTLACFGAALWGTSPVNVGALAWYAVYGQVLVATILLAALERLTSLARSGGHFSTRAASSWYALLLLGTTCFGVGVGIAVIFPVILFLLFPAAWRHRGVRLAYLALPLVTAVVYFGFRLIYLLVERLPPLEQTVPVFLLTPRWPVVLMLREFLAFSVAATLQSFFFLAAAYPDTASSTALAIFCAGLVVLVWRGDGATRRTTLAMVLLAIGIYLVIAAGRAHMVSPQYPLRARVAALRYHYVGAVPIVVIACLALRQFGRIGWLSAVPRGPLLLAALAMGTLGYVRSDFNIPDRAASRSYLDRVRQGIAAEVARKPPGSTLYLENPALSSVLLGPVSLKREFPGRAAVFLLEQSGDEMNGRRLRFVERDPAVLAWYARRPDTPLARLMVAPGSSPGGP